jgi:acetyl-CoA carboxylase biotin carboxyl carrier protein
MDINEVRKLVKLVESSAIDELEIHEDKLQIRISKGRAGTAVSPPGPEPHFIQAQPHGSQPPKIDSTPHEAKVEPKPSAKNENLVEICSPMVGTFYRAPAPDTEPYVREGDSIHPGKVLCIVEAMKLMNEIEAEIQGKIVKIMVDNAHPVEYNQPIFLIEKQ